MRAGLRDPRARLRPPSPPSRALLLAPNAPDSYVVKHGDTLWGIAKVFLRDPWYWPEIWQVNPQIHNPHLIYPGDTLRLVYIDGKPQIVLQPGGARQCRPGAEPRVRSEPLEAAVTTIPYATVAAFMSKPIGAGQGSDQARAVRARHSRPARRHGRRRHGVCARILGAGRTRHSLQRGARRAMHCSTRMTTVVLGYNGVFTGSGHVTRVGDPATLIMTESTRETHAGDKLFPGDGGCAARFHSEPAEDRKSTAASSRFPTA